MHILRFFLGNLHSVFFLGETPNLLYIDLLHFEVRESGFIILNRPHERAWFIFSIFMQKIYQHKYTTCTFLKLVSSSRPRHFSPETKTETETFVFKTETLGSETETFWLRDRDRDRDLEFRDRDLMFRDRDLMLSRPRPRPRP